MIPTGIARGTGVLRPAKKSAKPPLNRKSQLAIFAL
jgi:hypothetical protein